MSRSLIAFAVVSAALAVTGPAAHAELAGSEARAFQAGLLDVDVGHSCAVLVGGAATCWGDDGAGKLGDDAVLAARVEPVLVALPSPRRAVAIGAGGGHTCAVLDDGTAACWGFGNDGQVGAGSSVTSSPTPVPVSLPAGRRAVAITAGNAHSCAILDDGSAACWGSDNQGQLGDGPPLAASSTPVLVQLPAGARALRISAGDTHTCAVLADGHATCWGRDVEGQLGDGATLASTSAPSTVALPPGRTAIAISSGYDHSCAILDDRSAACWGADGFGQLGNDAVFAPSAVPVAVALPAGRTATALAAGVALTCAVLDDGTLSCWGTDLQGQLGDDATLVNEPAPVAVGLPPGRRTVAVSTGQAHTCALLDDGSVRCWGSEASGQLGNGLDATAQPVAALAPSALAPNASAGGAADVSVVVEGAPGTLELGSTGSATVRVANGGPDSATGLRLLLQPALLALTTGLIGQGSVEGSYWDVGTLAPAATTTLTLTLTPVAAGTGSLTAQIAAAGAADPDSTPANGRPTEDDQATATIPITAPPPPPPPPAAKARAERLTLTLSTGKDTTAPHTTTARGRLVATAIAARTGCVGRVTLTGKTGTKTLVAKSARLKLKNGACEYSATLSLTARKRGRATAMKVTAGFAGNDALLPAGSKPKTLKLI